MKRAKPDGKIDPVLLSIFCHEAFSDRMQAK
ncbi:hypothetical protein BRIN106911_23875 [Brevibacillus invocatus]